MLGFSFLYQAQGRLNESPEVTVEILCEKILSVLFEQGAAKEEIFATQIICYAN